MLENTVYILKNDTSPTKKPENLLGMFGEEIYIPVKDFAACIDTTKTAICV